MNTQVDEQLHEVEALLYHCERSGNPEKAEALLSAVAASTDDPAVLATVFGLRAQAQLLLYDDAEPSGRRALAETGVRLARRALEHDPENLHANAWGAALMGVHGLEMGLLSALFYLKDIKASAEKVLRLDETYHSAMAHQILGDLHRLAPPSPIGVRDYARALEHLRRARSLSVCPMAKLRLAELYITLRKPDLAREEIRAALAQEIDERGPRYEARCRARARELAQRLPPAHVLEVR